MSVGLGLQYGETKADLLANLLTTLTKETFAISVEVMAQLGLSKIIFPSRPTMFLCYQSNRTILRLQKRSTLETFIGDILERKYASKHSVG